MVYESNEAIFDAPMVGRLLDLALEEDIGHGDITTQSIGVLGDATMEIVAKDPLICVGVPLIERLVRRAGLPVEVQRSIPEGSRVAAGDALVQLSGPATALLALESTASSFLRRMSGVATLTRAYVDELGVNSRCRVVDTRRTLPGWRPLDRYAVRLGGGFNHRYDLGSGVMIKENHIAACGSLSAAVERARRWAPHPLRIEVVVRVLSDLYEALQAGAEVLLLVDMSPEGVREAVQRVEGKALVEVGGSFSPSEIKAYADAGADFIAVGALTLAPPAAVLRAELKMQRG